MAYLVTRANKTAYQSYYTSSACFLSNTSSGSNATTNTYTNSTTSKCTSTNNEVCTITKYTGTRSYIHYPNGTIKDIHVNSTGLRISKLATAVNVSYSGTPYVNPSDGKRRLCIRTGTGKHDVVKYGLTTNSSASQYCGMRMRIDGKTAYIGRYETTSSSYSRGRDNVAISTTSTQINSTVSSSSRSASYTSSNSERSYTYSSSEFKTSSGTVSRSSSVEIMNERGFIPIKQYIPGNVYVNETTTYSSRTYLYNSHSSTSSAYRSPVSYFTTTSQSAYNVSVQHGRILRTSSYIINYNRNRVMSTYISNGSTTRGPCYMATFDATMYSGYLSCTSSVTSGFARSLTTNMTCSSTSKTTFYGNSSGTYTGSTPSDAMTTGTRTTSYNRATSTTVSSSNLASSRYTHTTINSTTITSSSSSYLNSKYVSGTFTSTSRTFAAPNTTTSSGSYSTTIGAGTYTKYSTYGAYNHSLYGLTHSRYSSMHYVSSYTMSISGTGSLSVSYSGSYISSTYKASTMSFTYTALYTSNCTSSYNTSTTRTISSSVATSSYNYLYSTSSTYNTTSHCDTHTGGNHPWVIITRYSGQSSSSMTCSQAFYGGFSYSTIGNYSSNHYTVSTSSTISSITSKTTYASYWQSSYCDAQSVTYTDIQSANSTQTTVYAHPDRYTSYRYYSTSEYCSTWTGYEYLSVYASSITTSTPFISTSARGFNYNANIGVYTTSKITYEILDSTTSSRDTTIGLTTSTKVVTGSGGSISQGFKAFINGASYGMAASTSSLYFNSCAGSKIEFSPINSTAKWTQSLTTSIMSSYPRYVAYIVGDPGFIVTYSLATMSKSYMTYFTSSTSLLSSVTLNNFNV